MKFLVTGSLRDRSGPRRLVALTLLLFLAFTGAHFARELWATGLSTQEVRRNLHGARAGEPGQLQAPRSPLMVFEDLHVDLFLHSMVFLFLGSLLVQSRLPRAARSGSVLSLFALALVYVSARIATAFAPGFAVLVGPLAIGYHLLVVAAILFVLYDLYAPMRRGGA